MAHKCQPGLQGWWSKPWTAWDSRWLGVSRLLSQRPRPRCRMRPETNVPPPETEVTPSGRRGRFGGGVLVALEWQSGCLPSDGVQVFFYLR